MEQVEDSLKDEWKQCTFCQRRWRIESLELDFCCDCLGALKRDGRRGYETVKLEMLLKFGEFQDPLAKEVLRMMWEEIQKRALDSEF